MDEIVEGMLVQMTYVLTVKMKYSPRDRVDKRNRFVKIVVKKAIKANFAVRAKKKLTNSKWLIYLTLDTNYLQTNA